MSEIQPVPGVVYNVKVDGYTERWLYAPSEPQHPEPWLRLRPADAERSDFHPDIHEIIGEAFNPHSPTRTEWVMGTSFWKEEEVFSGITAAQARLRDFEESYPGKFRLFSHEVSDWQEVTG